MSPIAITDRTGSKCPTIFHTLHVEDRDEQRERSFEELAAVGLFLARVVSDAPTLELWTKLDGTEELTNAEVAREVNVDRATVGRWLKSFRSRLRQVVRAHPEWIADLPERYRRNIP